MAQFGSDSGALEHQDLLIVEPTLAPVDKNRESPEHAQ